VGKAAAAAVDKAALLARQQGSYQHRKDAWEQAAAEADIQIKQANIQLVGAQSGIHATYVRRLISAIVSSRFNSHDFHVGTPALLLTNVRPRFLRDARPSSLPFPGSSLAEAITNRSDLSAISALL